MKRVFVEQEEAINNALGADCLTSPCNKDGAGPRIAFVGDSHARVLAATMQDDLKAHARHYNFGNSCPFFWGGAGLDDCTPERQAERLAALAAFQPDIIILSSRLAGYLRGGFFEGGETIKLAPQQVTDGVAQLLALAPVVAVYPTPAFSRGVVHSVQLTGEATTPRAEFDAWAAPAFEVLDGLQLGRFKPHEYLCDADLCYGFRDETVLFFDDDHMSAAAVELFREDFFDRVNSVLQTTTARIGDAP